ncbi:hypothetical protein [Citrobacter freundii]|uniref:hypothetical protein n=1 Tax=Citrobacter freundii TaxID=546 RepID=UPI00383BE02B
MKLYIANCSRQAHMFNYKLPEKTQSFGVSIPPGRQHMIENQSDIIDHIISQHEPYGFQRCDKVDKHFSGICYSIDKPVTVGRIEDGADQKTENLKSMSEEILAASAVSLNNAVDQAVIQSGEKPQPGGIDMEITGEAVNTEQENPPGSKRNIKVRK